MSNRRILIYAELKGGQMQPSSLELLSKAREVFPEKEVKVAFVAAGDGITDAVEALSKAGADAVYSMESEKLRIFNLDYAAAAVLEAVGKFDPDILLIAASTFGEELAPTLGVKLKTGVAAHCVDLKEAEDGTFVQLVPAFGGKVIGEILIPRTRPQIASVKPGMFDIVKQEQRNCSIEQLDHEALDKCPSKIQALRVVERKPEGMPLERAELVVCGGFGTGSQENWDNLEKLAELLGGAAGSTRPVIDEGWVPNEQRMIGTSGKTVRPKVYLGAGVSGATHHVCGMKDSGVVININRDENAEIFHVSDYKAVADGAAVIKELIALIGDKTNGTC